MINKEINMIKLQTQISETVRRNRQCILDVRNYIQRLCDSDEGNDPTVSDVIKMIKNLVITVLSNKNCMKKLSSMKRNDKIRLIVETIRNTIAKEIITILGKSSEKLKEKVLTLYDSIASESIHLCVDLHNSLKTSQCLSICHNFF